MLIGKNTVKQSLVWCTPMKTHLQKCSPLGISSGYSLARFPMMGLHCCVLTHHLVKDRAFNLSGALQHPDSLRDPKEGEGPSSGHLQSVSEGTGPSEEQIPTCGNRKILRQPFREQLQGSHGTVKITPSSMPGIVV